MSAPPESQPITVFVSYSHRDEEFKDELVAHLANLKRQGKIRAWQDRDIEAGTEWDAEIRQQLESAEIILLLISHYFINSDYCYDLEMRRAIERHQEGTARVIPIILKPCDWQETPFSKLQVLPKDGKPVSQWGDRDEAFLNVAQGIRRAVESLQLITPPPPNSAAPPTPNPLPETPPYRRPAGRLYTHAFSTYNPDKFTGRDDETAHLTQILNGGCRILAIAGMTGIGKTALAERIVANLMDNTAGESLPYVRFSLDDRSLTPDFSSSGAALLRTFGEEPTLEDQKDPANLVHHLLNHLQKHPCRLQIDSLERLLTGDEQEGWSDFCDPLWLDFLQQCLTANHFPSQLLLTTQEVPADLDEVGSRYPQFWHCQIIQGLTADEQRDLFLKLGFPQDGITQEMLFHIGHFYNGHPLALRVVAEEILQPPFQGNLILYWHAHGAEFTPTRDPNEYPFNRSRNFRRRVRQQVERSLQRLPESARQMLCTSAVFRRPVPVAFWYAMLPDGDAQAAFDSLQDRHLVEYESMSDNGLLVHQHNLIRSVAYDLLKADRPTWEAAERQAAHLWLNNYTPPLGAPNLETVRGYLEAFDHYLIAGDLELAKNLAWAPLNTPTRDHLCWQLGTWGHLHEQVLLHRKQLDIARRTEDSKEVALALGNLGLAYKNLGQYDQSIEILQQALIVNRKIGNRHAEGQDLGNLGNAFIGLRQYEQAIELHQQRLMIAREISDRHGEGQSLGNLGLAYSGLGKYEQAINLYQQRLAIAQEISDRRGAAIALTRMADTYLKMKRYLESLSHSQTALVIAQETGYMLGQAEALKNLAEAHQALGEVEVAQQYCQQALELAIELGIPLREECENLMRELEAG